MAVAFSRMFDRVVGCLVRMTRLNAISFATLHNQEVIYKRRNAFGRNILPAANVFFAATRAPIFFWADTRSWQKYEIKTYRMLHPRRAIAAMDDGLCQDRLPGKSMWQHLKAGTLRRNMVIAAAQAFRRAHGQWSEVHDDRWSHGDGAMCNVLYDPGSRTAHLIDFELMHRLDLPASTRQAEDLLSFLLDLVGAIPERRWLPYALAFVNTYRNPEVLTELAGKLAPPKGLAWVWWKIRTNFSDAGTITRRLEQLRQAMAPSLEPSGSRAPATAFPLPIATP